MNHNDSIIFRSGLTMGGIVLLALLSMISSVFIAESSKGDAAAINLSGSLRMQSYRIATRLQQAAETDTDHAGEVAREISEFERRLAHLWRTGAISAAEDNPRNRTLTIIESFWRENLRPILQTSATDRTPPDAYLRQVDDFVARLDAFVKLLEEDSEAKILLLRLVQGVALFMTLVLIFAAMHQLHSGVVAPLRDLVELARKARGGDLSVRASHVGNDELGVLGHAFNLMAADLSAMYADLEARVEQQTQALRISNRSLELLYNIARRLGEAIPEAATYQALLTDIERLTGMGSVHLCLIHPATHQATEMFSAHPRSLATLPPFCRRPNCEPCLGNGVAFLQQRQPATVFGLLAGPQRSGNIARHRFQQRQLPARRRVQTGVADDQDPKPLFLILDRDGKNLPVGIERMGRAIAQTRSTVRASAKRRQSRQ